MKESTSTEEMSADQLQRLKQCVKDAGGPSEIARRSGIPLGSLNRYLGGSEMKLSAAIAIASACRVSLDFLAMGLEQPDQKADIAIFRPEIWDAKAHFYALVTVLVVAREYYEKMGLVPTFGELMAWIGPYYLGHTGNPDLKFLKIEFQPREPVIL